MSEVNQAFLRAYLKNRALQATAIHAAPVSTDVRTPLEPNVARPTANAPRKPSSPPIQPSQSLPSGMKLRFDPTHTNTNPLTQPQPPLPSSGEPASHAHPVQARVSPTQGFWSPLGAERAMKALESTSLPAVVRNGVTAVTREAAQFRKPATVPTTLPTRQSAPVAQPTSVAQPAPKAPPVYSNEPSSRVSYDQVMYVDGLVGHAAPQRVLNSRPTEQTLAEITEPIAFGTGSPSHSTLPTQPTLQTRPTSLPTRTTILPTQSTQAHAKQTVPSGPTFGQQVLPKPTDERVTRRLDTSHLSNSVESATTSPLNTGLPLPVAFSPSWEVDLFYWPEVVKQIESSHADAFRQIGKHLCLANRDGLKVMAITSGERGVGRSTVAMHMARCAASAGLRVALLDGDTFCPSLIDQLRLDMQKGWQDCLFENVPLHEIAIHSIADRITLFPLTCVISQQQMHANLHRLAKLIRRISNAFDMVFIDANRLNLEQRDLVGVAQETVVDAAIVVVDTELSIKEKVDSAVSILRGMGISSIGLVENFQS